MRNEKTNRFHLQNWSRTKIQIFFSCAPLFFLSTSSSCPARRFILFRLPVWWCMFFFCFTYTFISIATININGADMVNTILFGLTHFWWSGQHIKGIADRNEIRSIKYLEHNRRLTTSLLQHLLFSTIEFIFGSCVIKLIFLELNDFSFYFHCARSAFNSCVKISLFYFNFGIVSFVEE